MTATQIIVEATQSAGFALTPAQTLDCPLSLGTLSQPELTDQLTAAFVQAEIKNRFVFVATFGVYGVDDCSTEFYPLRTFIDMEIPVDDLLNEEKLADLTADVLRVLYAFPQTEDFGPEPARLRITFRDDMEHRIIDTSYANALAAYEEGLRGAALLEALGGLVIYSFLR